MQVHVNDANLVLYYVRCCHCLSGPSPVLVEISKDNHPSCLVHCPAWGNIPMRKVVEKDNLKPLPSVKV